VLHLPVAAVAPATVRAIGPLVQGRRVLSPCRGGGRKFCKFVQPD